MKIALIHLHIEEYSIYLFHIYFTIIITHSLNYILFEIIVYLNYLITI